MNDSSLAGQLDANCFAETPNIAKISRDHLCRGRRTDFSLRPLQSREIGLQIRRFARQRQFEVRKRQELIAKGAAETRSGDEIMGGRDR
jgi:hypothetical protein